MAGVRRNISLVFLGQRQPQALRDGARDVGLYGLRIRERPIESLAPQLRHAVDVDEVGLDVKPVAALRNFAGNDGPHVQLTSGLARIDRAILITRGQRARYDPQRANLRERVGQGLGHAVAQVVSIGAPARVDERQHGNGVDRRAGRRLARPPSRGGEYKDGDNNQHRCAGSHGACRHATSGRGCGGRGSDFL